MRRLVIDGVEIGDDSPCYVIAEIGHNHQGDVEHAKRLIDAAKECGVDAVKLGIDAYRELLRYARDAGMTLFATAFDFESADELAELGVPAFKFASGDLKNTPLQRHIASFGRPLLLSTGGATMGDV